MQKSNLRPLSTDVFAGDEPGAEGNDAAKGRGPPRSVADVFAGDDWMDRMPEALRKQMQQMVDMSS